MASVRGWVGARVTIGTMFVVAALSVVIGIFNINSSVAGDVLAPYIPGVVRVTTDFTETLIGFLLLANVFEFRRRYRAV